MQIVVTTSARADLDAIFDASSERWGAKGRERYEDLIRRAFELLVRDPTGPITRAVARAFAGARMCHLRRARRGARVKDPVHVIYYRVTKTSIEIIRVLHERMNPGEHLDP